MAKSPFTGAIPLTTTNKSCCPCPSHEFLTRFLLHILPKGFVRIRHFGFLANRRRSTFAPVLSVAGRSPRTTSQRTPFLYGRRSRSLSLSQVWRIDEDHRTAHGCRDPTSFSTTVNRCCMKPLSPTPTLRVPRRAPSFSSARRHTNFLCASSTTIFAAVLCSSHLLSVAVTGHAPQRSRRHTSKPSSPQLNLHNARVRRTHGRPPPNGFAGRARSSSPPFTPERERASGKALALLGSYWPSPVQFSLRDFSPGRICSSR